MSKQGIINQDSIEQFASPHNSDPGKTPQDVLDVHHLSMVNSLQTTLEVHTLLKNYCKELARMITFDSLEYSFTELKQSFCHGQRATHELCYHLAIKEDSLGDLTFTRSLPFSDRELIIIESTLSILLFPLKNALSYQKAVHNSYICPLTKIGNRAAFDRAITREIQFSSRHLTPLSLLLMDIDFFKQVNDKYGHLAGDRILSELSMRLSALCRNSDLLFRYGGEEFALILSHTNEQGALQFAQRALHKVSDEPYVYQSHTMKLTMSIGLGTYASNDNESSLFKRADDALYRAKDFGRNRVEVQLRA